MTEDKSEPPKINLTLNIDSIIGHTQQAAITAIEVVDFVLDAIAKADLTKKTDHVESSFKFSTPEIPADARRETYESWILARGMQDLMRGLRKSLEQAHVFLNLLDNNKVKSSSTLDQYLAPFKLKATTLNFVDLLKDINSRLPDTLQFLDAYLSVQQARNCFEHRNGIVGNIDAPAGGVMILKFPRLKLFVEKDGSEVEVGPGLFVEAETLIHTKIELRERRFALGRRIELSITDFNEIAFACYFFATDLAQKVRAAIEAHSAALKDSVAQS